jgi:hypothetical protein
MVSLQAGTQRAQREQSNAEGEGGGESSKLKVQSRRTMNPGKKKSPAAKLPGLFYLNFEL